jgi:hypothetical protein
MLSHVPDLNYYSSCWNTQLTFIFKKVRKQLLLACHAEKRHFPLGKNWKINADIGTPKSLMFQT